MDKEELKRRIISSIDTGNSEMEHRDILVEFKQLGGTQKKAMEALSEVRTLRNDEQFDDVVLELMDMVYGWCRQEFWIWDIYYPYNPENFESTDS